MDLCSIFLLSYILANLLFSYFVHSGLNIEFLDVGIFLETCFMYHVYLLIKFLEMDIHLLGIFLSMCMFLVWIFGIAIINLLCFVNFLCIFTHILYVNIPYFSRIAILLYHILIVLYMCIIVCNLCYNLVNLVLGVEFFYF